MTRGTLARLSLLALLAAAGRSTGAQREERAVDIGPHRNDVDGVVVNPSALNDRGETIFVDAPAGRRGTVVHRPAAPPASSVSVKGVSRPSNARSCSTLGQQDIAVLLVTLP